MVKFMGFPSISNSSHMVTKRFVHFIWTFNFYHSITNITIKRCTYSFFPFWNSETNFFNNDTFFLRIPITSIWFFSNTMQVRRTCRWCVKMKFDNIRGYFFWRGEITFTNSSTKIRCC